MPKTRTPKFGAHGTAATFRNCLRNGTDAQSRVNVCISKGLDDCPREDYAALQGMLRASQALKEQMEALLAKYPAEGK